MGQSADNMTMNVSLPRSQKDYVERQSKSTGCVSVSEYVRRLIHDDQVRNERDRL